MPDDTVAPVRKLQILHRGEESLGLDLNSLRQKLPRTSSKNIRQWIVDLVGMTKGDNVANLFHGVSLSLRGSGRLDTRLDTPPISFRHHPVSRIARLDVAKAEYFADTQRQIAGLQRKVGQQQVELDFFRQALRRVEEARQRNDAAGVKASMRRSEQ
jgi:hypothetical protein